MEGWGGEVVRGHGRARCALRAHMASAAGDGARPRREGVHHGRRSSHWLRTAGAPCRLSQCRGGNEAAGPELGNGVGRAHGLGRAMFARTASPSRLPGPFSSPTGVACGLPPAQPRPRLRVAVGWHPPAGSIPRLGPLLRRHQPQGVLLPPAAAAQQSSCAGMQE